MFGEVVNTNGILKTKDRYTTLSQSHGFRNGAGLRSERPNAHSPNSLMGWSTRRLPFMEGRGPGATTTCKIHDCQLRSWMVSIIRGRDAAKPRNLVFRGGGRGEEVRYF